MHSGSPEVEAIERRYARDVLGAMSHREVLRMFAGLWAQACRMDPDFPGRWQDDIAPDLELARVLNGLGTP